MPLTLKQKESQKKYRELHQPVQYTIQYKGIDRSDGLRLRAYLENTGQSANSYIKGLIKADLDSKEIGYNGSEITDG